MSTDPVMPDSIVGHELCCICAACTAWHARVVAETEPEPESFGPEYADPDLLDEWAKELADE